MTRFSPWIQSRRRDQFYKLAKEKGYRSRAAFKLQQIIKSYKFIQKGDWVIELGAAPGGWTQVLLETVEHEGRVIAVDIQPMDPLKNSQVEFIELDITSDSTINLFLEKSFYNVDAIVSDISPNISGAWDMDHSKQIHLARRSLEIAKALLKSDGNFLVKVFQGREINDFLEEVKSLFRQVRLIRPKATRASSSEIYVLGLGFQDRRKSSKNTISLTSLSN